MHDLFDYLDWRGDIPFSVLGPVNADYAVFCSLSYIPFDGVVTDEGKESFIPLKDAADMVLKRMSGKKSGLKYHLPKDRQLLETVGKTARYGELKVGQYVNIFRPEIQEQFSAVSFLLPTGDLVVSFRGTDGTIIGWKEDFNMGFMDELPSQKDAVRYIERLARGTEGSMYLCGHSKGGNLAMYGAAFADKDVQERIITVRSLDGPGFKSKTTERRGFIRIKDRMETFMPQSTIVGLLLEHAEKNRIIHSVAKGSKQHDMYTWSIRGGDFCYEEGLTESSLRVNRAAKEWITEMSDEKRMKLTDGIFEIIETTQAETLEELFGTRNMITVMKSLGKMDDEKKELIIETGRIIMASQKGATPKKQPKKRSK